MKNIEKIIMFDAGEKIYPIKVIFTNNIHTYFQREENIFVLRINGYSSFDDETIRQFIKKSIMSFERKKNLASLEIDEEEKFFNYLGKKIYYIFENNFIYFKINNEQIKLKSKSNRIKDSIWSYLNEKLFEIINNLIEKNINFICPKLKKYNIKIMNKKTAWGTNYVNKSLITFSKYLIEFNVDIIEYVVIHELTHFLYQNHSKKFWEKVALNCPNYKEKRKCLNQHIFNFNLK